MKNQNHYKDGVALASILAGSIGCAVIGMATVAAEWNTEIKGLLTWWAPAGPLSGKTGIGVIAWFVSWIVLHLMMKSKELPFFGWVFRFSLVLVGIGWLGTFPPFFELFAPH